jgi:hypothetical protein
MYDFTVELVGQELGKGTNPSAQCFWQVRGTEDRAVAYAMLQAASPTTCQGLIRQHIQLKEEGGGIWSGRVEYGVHDTELSTWSFEIGTEALRVTHAKEHIADYPASATNHQGAINVVKDGAGKIRVEGADVLTDTFTWEETHFLPYDLVATYDFVANLKAAKLHVNDADWRIWNAGEVLFLGATGAKRNEETVPITYRFQSSDNVTGWTVGTITGIDKQGHHLAWVEYAATEDAVANDVAGRAKAVHIERVYDYVDFSTLGIGDAPWS